MEKRIASNSILIQTMEDKVRGWKNRAIHLHNLHQQFGHIVTLWEAEKAEKRTEQLEKELKRKKEAYGYA